jgi:uncharacterized protein YukE
MAADPQEFFDLVYQVDELARKAIDEIVDEAGKIADMLNGAAGSFGQFLDDILPGENELEHAIDKWNNDLCPAIEQGINSLSQNVQSAVDRLAGNPMDLKQYAENFANAKVDLYKPGSMAQKITTLGQSWEGNAYDAYSTVATEQDEALHAISTALESGATNTMAAANKILDLWRQLVREFTGFQSDIIRLLASATDASKVLTLEVPTILEAIAVIWDKINNIADILADFMIGQATTDALNWLMLKNGSDGLPENRWPAIEEDSSDTMDDPKAWHVPA